jgi:hypothetical protein
MAFDQGLMRDVIGKTNARAAVVRRHRLGRVSLM